MLDNFLASCPFVLRFGYVPGCICPMSWRDFLYFSHTDGRQRWVFSSGTLEKKNDQTASARIVRGVTKRPRLCCVCTMLVHAQAKLRSMRSLDYNVMQAEVTMPSMVPFPAFVALQLASCHSVQNYTLVTWTSISALQNIITFRYCCSSWGIPHSDITVEV